MIGCEPQIDLVTSMREKSMKNKDRKKRAKKNKWVKNLLESLTIEDQPINFSTSVDEYKAQVQELFEEKNSPE